MNFEKQIQYAGNLLDILPDGIIAILPDGKILRLNLQAQTELHRDIFRSEKEKGDLFISDLVDLIVNDEDILSQLMEKLNQGVREIVVPHNTCIFEKATNTIFPIKGQFSTFYVENKLEGIIFYFRNITTELTHEYILNTALRRTKIYPWFLDIDRKLFVLDARYFEYLGIPAGPGNTLTMDEYTNLVHPDDRQELFEAFAVQFSGNIIYEKPVVFRIHRGDGTWEWFEGQSTYMGKLSGLPYRLVGICMSIQEHKDIENTLITARIKAEESDKLKSAFLANMSHEIRTPLNAIVGFSEVLTTTFEELSKEDREKFVALISSNSEQLLVLINDILDLSRIESNSMEFVFTKKSLKNILQEIYSAQKWNDKLKVKFELQLPEEDVEIITDAVRLKQVINNLVNNAIKFTYQGSIRIGFQKCEGEQVEIFVRDTGEGIPKEYLERIFERFYKVNSFRQGTGLGLSICRTIVEYLKGKIDVTSALNQGSCFTITLPLQASEEI